MPFPDLVVSYEAKHISRAAIRGTVAFFSSQIDIVEVFPCLSPYRYLCIFRAMQSIYEWRSARYHPNRLPLQWPDPPLLHCCRRRNLIQVSYSSTEYFHRFGASPSCFYTWVLWWFIESSVTGFARFGRVCNTPLFHIEDQLFMTLW